MALMMPPKKPGTPNSKPTPQRQAEDAQAEEIRKLKAELRRVTEERDILKEAAVYFAGESKKSTRS